LPPTKLRRDSASRNADDVRNLGRVLAAGFEVRRDRRRLFEDVCHREDLPVDNAEGLAVRVDEGFS
jgi:hypothetical protein